MTKFNLNNIYNDQNLLDPELMQIYHQAYQEDEALKNKLLMKGGSLVGGAIGAVAVLALAAASPYLGLGAGAGALGVLLASKAKAMKMGGMIGGLIGGVTSRLVSYDTLENSLKDLSNFFHRLAGKNENGAEHTARFEEAANTIEELTKKLNKNQVLHIDQEENATFIEKNSNEYKELKQNAILLEWSHTHNEVIGLHFKNGRLRKDDIINNTTELKSLLEQQGIQELNYSSPVPRPKI